LYTLQIIHILFHLNKIIPKVHNTPILWPFESKLASVSCNDPYTLTNAIGILKKAICTYSLDLTPVGPNIKIFNNG